MNHFGCSCNNNRFLVANEINRVGTIRMQPRHLALYLLIKIRLSTTNYSSAQPHFLTFGELLKAQNDKFVLELYDEIAEEMGSYLKCTNDSLSTYSSLQKSLVGSDDDYDFDDHFEKK